MSETAMEEVRLLRQEIGRIAQEFTGVLVGDIRGRKGIMPRLDAIETRLDQMSDRLDELATAIAALNARLDQEQKTELVKIRDRVWSVVAVPIGALIGHAVSRFVGGNGP